MALALNDIIQITTRVDYLGQECLNVWHYRLTLLEAGVSYTDLADDMAAFWTNTVAAFTHTAANLTQVDVLNLTNGLDIFSKGYNLNGLRPGAVMPSFTAWSFQFLRGSRLTRHGWKRFVGVSEDDTTGNDPTGTIEAILNTSAAEMFQGVVRSGTAEDFTLTPIIIGRTLVAGVYELDLTKINTVTSVVFSALTTQNSRKA